MRLPSALRARPKPEPGIIGVARADKRTAQLRTRLHRGDIALVNHVDLDRAAAESLVEGGVAVVVNIAPSISGRYPNLGPAYLLDAGVVLVDNVDEDVFAAVDDGDILRVDGADIYRDDVLVGSGTRQTSASVREAWESAKDGIATQMAAFSANAVEHLHRERSLLTDGEGIPSVSTPIRGRHVLVVSRSFDYRAELDSLKSYIREHAPVLIGVDAGGDALLEAGYRPDLVIAEVEKVSDPCLRCGAEVVAHASRVDHAGTTDRLERLGVNHATFVSTGTSNDAALLLAHHAGAGLIVQVGSHGSLIEFFDRGRSTMASSFLTQLVVGGDLVDARAVARLYQHRLRARWIVLILLVCVAVVVGALLTTPVGQDWYDQVRGWSVSAYDSVRGTLS